MDKAKITSRIRGQKEDAENRRVQLSAQWIEFFQRLGVVRGWAAPLITKVSATGNRSFHFQLIALPRTTTTLELLEHARLLVAGTNPKRLRQTCPFPGVAGGNRRASYT